MHTLLVYASKYGCTEKCAKLVSEKLHDNVDMVNLKNEKDIDLSKYDKVIIGGSIYIGRILKEITEFCSKYLNILKDKKIGIFICGMQKDAIETEINQNFPPEILEIVHVKESFGGEFIFEKMNFWEKTIVKIIAKTNSDISEIQEDNIDKFTNIMNSI